jgi:flagellar hook-associated protein 2
MDGVLGLAGGGSASLSNDVITKLKEAEEKATIEPIDTHLENWEKGTEEFSTISAAFTELFSSMEAFSRDSSSTNPFDNVSASTTGTDVATYDAATTAGLKPGTTNVHIDKVATKDVWQSDALASAATDTMSDATISIKGVDYTTNGKTYENFAKELDNVAGITASYEEVASGSYRLVIKSDETGVDNRLNISTSSGFDYFADGDGDGNGVDDNNTLVAINLEASVDGVAYNQASNTLNLDGDLKMTALKAGDSAITLTRDTSAVIDGIKSFAEKYNTLVDLLDAQRGGEDEEKFLYQESDISILRSVLEGIKDKVFQTYGLEDDGDVSRDRNNDGVINDSDKLSMFNYGIELDRYGKISIDDAKLSQSMTNDFESVRELLSGAEDYSTKGFGTILDEYKDEVNYFQTGLMSVFENSWIERKSELDTEKEEAQEKIDEKYTQMTAQFAEYGAMIAQMEALFSGLKQQIQMETASN